MDLSGYSDEELLAIAGMAPGNEFGVPPVDESELYGQAPRGRGPIPAPMNPMQAAAALAPPDLSGLSNEELLQLAGVEAPASPATGSADPLTGLEYGSVGAVKNYVQAAGGLTEFLAEKADPYLPDIPVSQELYDAFSPVQSSRRLAETLQAAQEDVGFEPSVDFDDVLERPFSAGPKFVAEQLPVSLPYLAAATNLPGNIFNLFSLTGNVAEERAQNKNEEYVSGDTLAESVPSGIASALFERLGLSKILKPIGKTPIGRIFGAGAGEAVTEAPQEAIEYAGATLGTDKEFSAAEAGKRAGAGALVGGPTGAGVRAPIELIEAFGGAPAGATTETPAPDIQDIPTETLLRVAGLDPAPDGADAAPALPAEILTPGPAPDGAAPALKPEGEVAVLERENPVINIPEEEIAEIDPEIAENPQIQPENQEEIANPVIGEPEIDFDPGYFTPQDIDEAGPAQVLAGNRRLVSGTDVVGTGDLLLRRGVDEDFDQTVAARQAKLKPHEVTAGADADNVTARVFGGAETAMKAAAPLEAAAAYDPVQAGREGSPTVIARAGEEWVTLDAKTYDYLVNRKGYELRKAPGSAEIGIFNGNDLVGVTTGYRQGPDAAAIRNAAALAGNALRGDDLKNYLAQRRPPAKVGTGRPAKQPLPRGGLKNAQAAKDKTIADLDGIMQLAAEQDGAGQKKYTGPRDVVIDTPSGQKTKLQLAGDTPAEIFKSATNMKLDFKARGASTFYQQLPGADGAPDRSAVSYDEQSSLPPARRPGEQGEGPAAPATQASTPAQASPAAGPEQSADESGDGNVEASKKGVKIPPGDAGGFRARLLSMRRGIWREAGIDPDIGENMPPLRQYKTMQKIFLEKFNVEIGKTDSADMSKVLSNLKDFYVEMQMLANIVKIPSSAIGLQNAKLLEKGPEPARRLKLGFSRDNNSGVLGAYSSGTHEIRLPDRYRSFAHEWGHALDYFILDSMGKTQDSMGKNFRGYTSRVRREGDNYFAPSVSEAFIDVMNTMFFDESFAAAKIMELELKMGRARSETSKADIARQIEEVKAGNYKGKDYRSPYYRTAKTIPAGADKGYWTRPTEMWARAFEAWVQYQAQKAGMDLDLLAARKDVYTGQSGDMLFDMMYPQGFDRARIFTAIGKLMDVLNTSEIIHDGQGAAERPADLDTADPLRWFKDIPGYQEPTKTLKDAVFGTPEERAELRASAARMLGFLRGDRPISPVTFAQAMNNLHMTLFSSIGRQLRVIEARYKKNPSPALSRVINGVWGNPGTGRAGKKRFDTLEANFRDKYLNTLAKITKRYKLNRFNDGEMKALRHLLLGVETDVPAELKARKADLIAAAGALREIWNGTYADAKENFGVDIGYIKDEDVNYINRIDDMAYIATHKDESVKKFTEAFKMKYEDLIASGEFNPPKNFDLDTQATADAEAHIVQLLLGNQWDQGLSPPKNSVSKSRTLPGRADLVLEDVRITNPIDALEVYITNLAARSAWTKTLEPKEGDFNRAFEDMIREGVNAADVKMVRDLILSAVGRREKTGIMQAGGRGTDWLNAVLTMVMLGRAPFASLHEPTTAGLRTGDIRDSLGAWTNTLKEILEKADSKERDDILQAYGVISSNIYSMSIAERTGGTYENIPKMNAMMTNFFRRNLLGPLTDFQRKVAVRVGQTYFLRMAQDAIDKSAPTAGKSMARSKRDYARAEFREMGIPENEIDDFANYLIERDGALPDLENARADLETFDQKYARALTEFSWQVIQNPKNVNRSYAANTPVGRFFFGFLSFSFAAYENIFKRAAKVAQQQYKSGGLPAAGAYLARGVLIPYAALWAASTAGFTLRTLLLGRQYFDELDDEEKMKYLMTGGFVYTSPAGPLADMLYNVTLKVKYDKDLANAFVGKLGYLINIGDTYVDFLTKNSANTDKQERKTLEATYRFLLMPAMAIATAVAPVTNTIGTLFGMANMWAGSRDAQESLSDAVFGPEEDAKKTPKRQKARSAGASRSGD